MDSLYAALAALHLKGERQGPGGSEESRLAMRLAGLQPSRELKIADIGCGTGASALLLAKELLATVTAVDFLPPFLEELQHRARQQDVADRIETLACSMTELPFTGQSFDVLWAEGSIYNMGFENGIRAWRPFLKPGGVLVVSEITWLCDAPPKKIREHWEREYSEIAAASVKLAQLERHGYSPMGYFVLPETCWRQNYYQPLQERFSTFLSEQGYSSMAQDIIAAEEQEIALYEEFHQFYSYGMYVARRNT